ncbi:MAG TPA: hypothetical protein VND93_26495, partial [Myxococcales bacterium]|nr:hypothetical protein [Myxococcales bacterium]
MSAPRWVAAAAAAAAASLCGCFSVSGGPAGGLSSFVVSVDYQDPDGQLRRHVYFAGTQTPVDVVKACADRYGGQAAVPERDADGQPVRG